MTNFSGGNPGGKAGEISGILLDNIDENDDSPTKSRVVRFDATQHLKKNDDGWTYDSLNAFVTSSQIKKGSAENGLHVFRKADCAKCHRLGAIGESVGPDLTDVAKRFRPTEILEAIVEPSKVISEQYKSKTVVTVDGVLHTGIVSQATSGAVTVLKSDGRKVRVAKDEVDSIEESDVSVMPSGLLNQLSETEIRDLFVLLADSETKIADRSKNEKAKTGSR